MPPELDMPKPQRPLVAAANDGVDHRELVAYARYEQKGANAQREEIYIRKSNFMRGGYVMINGRSGARWNRAGRVRQVFRGGQISKGEGLHSNAVQ
jgi:hypothetical protein